MNKLAIKYFYLRLTEHFGKNKKLTRFFGDRYTHLLRVEKGII